MITIRQSGPQDRADIEACFFELQAFERSIYSNRADPASMTAPYVDYLFGECASHDGAIFVAESEGDVVGFICVICKMPAGNLYELAQEFAYISDLVVRESQRGQGIGSQLMKRAEEYAIAHGATRLRIGVLAANEGAHALYRRLGFGEYGILLEKML